MADLALALTMAVWGSTFAVLRTFLAAGTGTASPMAMLALRMGLASALLGLFIGARRLLGIGKNINNNDFVMTAPDALERPETPSPGAPRVSLWRDGALCGFLLGLGFLLQTEGLQRTTASRSGFLTGLLVVFTPLLELLLFRKRPRALAVVALGIAFAGMAILSGPFRSGGTGLGDLLTVGCALVFSGHILALGRAAPRQPLLPLLLCQLVAVGLMAAVAGPLLEPAVLPREPKLMLAIAYLAVFATLLAFAVQTWAQRHVTPVRIALLSALEPVFAAAFAALLIGERLRPRELLGGGLIIAGVLVGEVGSAWLARRAPDRTAA